MGKRPNIIAEYDTNELRKEVGKKISTERETFFENCSEKQKNKILSERKRKRNYTGISMLELAMLSGIDEDTIYNLENGKGELKVEYLYKISQALGCDISYLLGECDTRKYVNQGIPKLTGLDETSIDILKDSLFYTRNEYSQYDEYEEVFLKLINKIIQSHSIDNLLTSLDELKPDTFPISHISEYIAKSIRYANLKKNACFDTLSNIDEGIRKNLYDSIAEGLKVVEGYTDEEIENLRPLIREYQALTDFKEHSRYERIDIQDAFSRFLTSDFISSMGVEK